jgi:type II secretory pathway component GspD/PulD (secretin)
VPEFFNRSVSTQVVVRDRQVLVLGALLSTEQLTSERRLPILGKIPLLKYLFSSRRDHDKYRELIFFVKPTIHRGGYVPRPEFLESELNEK